MQPIDVQKAANADLAGAAATAMYTYKADDLVDRANPAAYKAMPLSEVKSQLIVIKPAGVPEADAVAADATRAAELKFGQGVVSRMGSDEADEVAARDSLSQIQDPAVHAGIEDQIDLKDAKGIVSDLRSGHMTVAEARADAANIKQPRIRQIINKLIAKAMGAPDTEVYTDASSDLYDVNIGSTYQEDEAFMADQKRANNTADDLTYQGFKAFNAVDNATTQQVAALNGVHSPETASLPTLANPDEIVSFAQAKGTRKVRNNGYDKDAKEDDANIEKMPTFEQFAEIHAVDGQLILDFSDAKELDEQTRTQMEEIFQVNLPLLEAAMGDGGLVSVRWVKAGDEFNPFYMSSSREIYLPTSNKPLSKDGWASALRHETGHALLRHVLGGDMSDETFDKLAITCGNVRSLAYDYMEQTFASHPELLANLRAKVKPEHQGIIDTLAKDVKSNTVSEDLLYTKTTVDCNHVDVSLGLMYDARNHTTLPDKADDDLGYMFSLPEYRAVDEAWNTYIDYLSLYRMLNERNYVSRAASPEEVDLMGHTYENYDEFNASLFDVLLGYADKYKANRAKLSGASASYMDQAANNLTGYIMADHPSLVPLMQAVRQQQALRG